MDIGEYKMGNSILQRNRTCPRCSWPGILLPLPHLVPKLGGIMHHQYHTAVLFEMAAPAVGLGFLHVLLFTKIGYLSYQQQPANSTTKSAVSGETKQEEVLCYLFSSVSIKRVDSVTVKNKENTGIEEDQYRYNGL